MPSLLRRGVRPAQHPAPLRPGVPPRRLPCKIDFLKFSITSSATAVPSMNNSQLTVHDSQLRRPLEQHWSQKVHASRCTAVRHWLAEHCRNEAETLVYRLTFEEELKPGQIVARYPEHFPNVQDVYRIKQRLYRRIQRSFEWEE